jgi:ABC-type transporter Mla maintaining outer membrane lipid asymmetry ATPase subunit MlaF
MHHVILQPVPGATVALRGVRKVYGRGGRAVRALDGVDVDFCGGTFTAVMGPSGSGKSTLLHCAAGLERPTAGAAWLAGTDLTGLSETALTRLRPSTAWSACMSCTGLSEAAPVTPATPVRTCLTSLPICATIIGQ